jgi:hypothetical protein
MILRRPKLAQLPAAYYTVLHLQHTILILAMAYHTDPLGIVIHFLACSMTLKILTSFGTFDEALVPYGGRPYSILYLCLLSSFISKHKGHITLQCNSYIYLKPVLRNWHAVELVLSTNTTNCTGGNLLPYALWIHQPNFLPH